MTTTTVQKEVMAVSALSQAFIADEVCFRFHFSFPRQRQQADHQQADRQNGARDFFLK